MLPVIDIQLRDVEPDACPNHKAIVEKAVRAAGQEADLQFPQHAELSIMLSDDATVQSLNREWRNIDKPTNVLSFPSGEFALGSVDIAILGDIVVSMETVAREAELESKAFEDHFTHLIVHGYLHLFGYDHETEMQARSMESMEVKILATLGIDDPYEHGK